MRYPVLKPPNIFEDTVKPERTLVQGLSLMLEDYDEVTSGR